SPLFQDPNIPSHFIHSLTPISISAPSNCSWTIDPPDSWLHIDSITPANQTGPGTINVWAEDNSGPARKTTLTVHNGVNAQGRPATASVNQSPVPPCTPVTKDVDTWGGGELTSINQDVVVGVAASGTKIHYLWVV